MFSFCFSYRQIPLDIGKETLFTLRPGICYIFISDIFYLMQMAITIMNVSVTI